MSGDREARVLGAAKSIMVDGKDYQLRPVVAQHLCDLERVALRHYKRQYLETFKENADLFVDGNLQALLERKMEEAARWDLDDLPQKDAFDASRIPVTKKIKAWVADTFGEVPDTDRGIRAILTNALDTKRITAKQVKELSGKAPIQGRVRYDQWWITASMNGMITFITISVQSCHPDMSKEKVSNWPFGKIAEAARIVESITTASMGNT